MAARRRYQSLRGGRGVSDGRPREANGWLGAGAAALVDRVMTFTYFIPTMLTLMREGALSQSAAASKARQWVALGYVRHAATLVAWLAALRALSLA